MILMNTTLSPEVVGVALLALGALAALLALWLGLLTALVVRRLRYHGEPVFRRLPDGRVRFTWAVAQGLARAQRTVEVGGRRAPAGGPPPRPVGRGPR